MSGRNRSLTRRQRGLRLLRSALDPKAHAHMLKMVNYYNYTHVQPMRRIRLGAAPSISPDTVFANPDRIQIGDRARIGSRCMLWGGPSTGRVVLGNDVLLGPEVLLTAANYRFGDGSPVADQAMDEGDIVLGDDVWLGARVIVLPGVRIGAGAVVGAGSVVRHDIAPWSIAVGVPARTVGSRSVAEAGPQGHPAPALAVGDASQPGPDQGLPAGLRDYR